MSNVSTVSRKSGERSTNGFPADCDLMRYYDLRRHWTKRIMPHLGDEELNRILVRDFNKFTWGRWRKRFLPGMFPDEMESCDWQWKHHEPHPRYWRYVKHSACHWLVNFALRLAMLAEPTRIWRIVTCNGHVADGHSAVWDGRNTLFDLQFFALGVPITKCCEMLKGGTQLKPGQYLKVYLAQHYTSET